MSAASRPGPELRIGDAEREAAVSALGDHYTAGRITRDEFEERSSRAFAARTSSELWPLFNDLPPLPRSVVQPPERGPAVSGAAARRRPERPGWWFGAGMTPVFLIVIALVVLANLPWPVLLLVGWIWWSRTCRHWSRGHTMGSRRAVRGTCS